jgi:indole-3-glycerol phosphate synthase
LADFTVDLNITSQLMTKYGQEITEKGILIVSESGIYNATDIETVAKSGAKAVLIGESLVKQEDPGSGILELFSFT